MGYFIFSIGIDIPEIKAVFGSGNEILFNDIVTTSTFGHYSGQHAEAASPARQALEDIIYGNPFNENFSCSYWYAFIAICSHLGKRFPGTHEIKMSHEPELINEILKEDFGVDIEIDMELLGENAFPELPANDDFPLSGILNTDALQAAKQKLAVIDITSELFEQGSVADEEREMAYASIWQMIHNINFCLEHHLSLISFCH